MVRDRADLGHAQLTLNSMGDAVLSTGITGRIDYLNAAGEQLTGWSAREARGRLPEQVLRLIDAVTRKPIESPLARALREDGTVRLAPGCLLIQRDSTEIPIEDSAAPIYDLKGVAVGAVMVFRNVTKAMELSLRMSYLAEHDSLTALPNRLLLDDRLKLSMAMADRHRKKLAVLFLDIDQFKKSNDSLGHAVGDQLLQSVATRLVGCVRKSDTVFRIGGDEFVVLLSELRSVEDAITIAEKILRALQVPLVIEEHTLHVTASIGIAAYPDHGMTTEMLLNSADTAMYEAKTGGGNASKLSKAVIAAPGSGKRHYRRHDTVPAPEANR